jgi:hypothetical protein
MKDGWKDGKGDWASQEGGRFQGPVFTRSRVYGIVPAFPECLSRNGDSDPLQRERNAPIPDGFILNSRQAGVGAIGAVSGWNTLSFQGRR